MPRPIGLLFAALLALAAPAVAEDAPGPFLFEAGLVGGDENACPGRFVAINGQVAGPFSLYGMVENWRCAEVAGTANRAGGAIRLGRADALIRPSLRAGIEYDGGDVSPHAGASLTFGRRYGARLIVQFSEALTLFQMGAFFSF